MKITRAAGPDELTTSLAHAFLDLVGDIQAAGEVPRIVLTGGTIADALHRRIAELAAASGIDWTGVDWFWGDERFVPADSPDRNAGQARAALLDHVGVAAFRVKEMPAAEPGLDVHQAAAQYAHQLHDTIGDAPFDLVMLGVGPDAHIASLFPGHDSLHANGVTVAETNSPKPPPERVSLTVPRLLNSEQVWVLASGESKRPALDLLLDPAPITVDEAPVRALLPHRALTLWTDLA